MKSFSTILLAVVTFLILSGCNISNSGDGSTPQSSNRAPTIVGNPTSYVAVGEIYQFAPGATDADGDLLTFSIQNMPTWASFDATDGRLYGTPLSGDIGIYTGILISVSDGSNTVSLPEFTINVLNGQQTGKLISFDNNLLSVNEGSLATATVTRSDNVGVATVLVGTHGLTAVSSTANGDDYLGFDPTLLTFTDGEMTKTITVQTLDNSIQEDAETFEIFLSAPSNEYLLGEYTTTVVTIIDDDNAQNQPPSISGTPGSGVIVNNSYTFTPSASDPDGDSLSFTIINQPIWATFDPVSGSLSGTPDTGAIGLYADIVISVSDGHQSSSLPAFNISVSSNNSTPVALSDNISLNQNTTAIIDVLANDVGLNDGIDSLALTSNATHGSVQINTDNTIQYVPHSDYFGSDVFTYQITDSDGETDSAEVFLTINCITNCIVNSNDNTFYVRQGASGNNTGTDWNNAFTQLPDTLTRGATYLVADGNYPGYNFNDPASGTEHIRIQKASVSNHGSDTGWNDMYGDGVSTFGIISFTSAYYTFDGVYDYGFKVLGSYQSLVLNIYTSHIIISHTDIDGNFELTNGYQTNGACTGLNITGTDVTIQYSDIHNIADDAVTIYDSYSVNFLSNKLHNLHACGTDNGCGPCYNGHSDGLELNNTSDLTISGNMVYDIKSTAALFTGNWSPTYVRNLTLTNNIFYTPETGLTVYLQYIQNANVYNNVIWGLMQGTRFGGLSIGPEVTGLKLYNNIILSMNFSHTGGVFNPTEHDIDYNIYGTLNTSEYTTNTHEIIADPLFVNIPLSSDINLHILDGLIIDDFMLGFGSPAIDSGYDLTGFVDRDIYESSRPQDGNGDLLKIWDIGPIEVTP